MVPSSPNAWSAGKPRRSTTAAPLRRSRATRSTPSRAALLSLLVVIAVLFGVLPPTGSQQPFCIGKASAQEKEKASVVVLDVTGAVRLQQVIAQALKKDYNVVSVTKWNTTAKRLNATGRAADEIALVATELKVDVVITGAVKKDKETGQYQLSVSPRHGPSGKPVDKLRYQLKAPRVDRPTITQLMADLGPAVEKALKGAPEIPVIAEAEPKPDEIAAVDTTLGKDDDPMDNIRKMEAAEKKKAQEQQVRPRYYPYIDAGAGFIVGGRKFGYDEDSDPNSPIKCYAFQKPVASTTVPNLVVYSYSDRLSRCPSFNTSVAPGIRLDLTAYPLANLPYSALRGLGVGGTLDYMFWPPSRVCTKADSCGPELSTTEFRLEAGLRWHWNVLNRRSMPSVMLQLQYGMHYFAISKVAKKFDAFTDPTGTGMTVTPDGLDSNGLPDIRYQYIDIGLGGRIPYYASERLFLGAVVDFHYHAVLSYGELESKFLDTSNFSSLYQGGGYGPVSGGYGFRVGLTPMELIPWKGVTVRLSGYYEVFSMSFQNGSQSASQYELPPTDTVKGRQGRALEDASRYIARGASDQYFGGLVQVGYQY